MTTTPDSAFDLHAFVADVFDFAKRNRTSAGSLVSYVAREAGVWDASFRRLASGKSGEQTSIHLIARVARWADLSLDKYVMPR